LEALLALEDGTLFRGRSFGATGTRAGEVVFNTSMAGYQEVLTDPSYAGQIVVMTSPHQGNYGVNDEDGESDGPKVEGFVVRDASRHHSSWRSRKDLHQYLKENGVAGQAEVDTRALTRHIRCAGAMRGCLSTEILEGERLAEMARQAPRLGEQDLVRRVTCRQAYPWGESRQEELNEGSSLLRRGEGLHVVAFDLGVKRNILRCLRDTGVRVSVVPGDTPAAEALARNPDGVFLSNGPGDPEAAGYAAEAARKLFGRVPLFGICLGHQILALAAGARTFKLKFGHRGVNHPVQELATGRISITSQNHGYAVEAEALPESLEVTHLNLNDGTVEGLRDREGRFDSVQYHPEASPGPHDALGLFDRFLEAMGRPAAGLGEGETP
jgi:carbamoyl-phosphate synthase small subunit